MTTRTLLSNRLRFFLIALLVIPYLQAISSFGASHDASNVRSGFLFDNLPILSDLDGDDKPDRATLLSNGPFKSIQIAFGKSSWSSLSFDSTVFERGRLVSGDIDDDGDIDLIWIGETSERFVTWLGDGHGNFSIATDKKIDLNRIWSLLGDATSRLSDHANRRQIQAVLVSTSLVVLRAFEYRPYLRFQPRLAVMRTPVVCGLHFSVLTERGPPLKLF
jgi:hypothetical protein